MTDSLDTAVAAAGLPAHWSWRVQVRPRRRTVGLDVLPDGSILIAVPPGARPADVAAVVRSRRLWLATALKRRADLSAEHPAKELVDGEGFEYLGRRYQLKLVDDLNALVKLHGGALVVRRPGTDQEGLAAIAQWYGSRGRRWLSGRAGAWAGRIGAGVPSVRIDDLGTRWGLRNRDGSVTFHWAAIQLPADLLDLVVVHELVHLLVSHHNDEFRRRLLLALPDAAELEARLAQVGRHVWLGAARGEWGHAAVAPRCGEFAVSGQHGQSARHRRATCG